MAESMLMAESMFACSGGYSDGLFLRVRDTPTLETYALKVKITQGTRSHYT